MLEGILPLAFVLLATLVYLGSFSREIKNRFLVYTRLRTPLRKMLRIKFAANFLVTFGVFFVFTFGYFLFSFYIVPLLRLVQFHPEVYMLNEVTVVQDSYTRHTFTQLLQFGSLTYGFFYSCWVGLNAAVYATIGFFMVLIIRNQFLALSIPFLLYILGSFVMAASGLMRFRFPDAVFPYSYMQLPIWTAFAPFLFLLFICIILFLAVNKNLERIDNVI
ncbi:ABC transporter permease [Paenibacillus xerothermodurans]|nr:ABC transporter permease [Paenibacillus xerothermodurans]